MTDPTAVHRALADPHRAELAAALEEAVEALDASELARRVGLHANTVRWHLGILEDAGIVSSHPERRSTPGRPRRVWERTPREEHDEVDEHRALARALVSAVAGRPEAAADAEAAGRAWGRVAGRRSGSRAGGSDVLVRVLDTHGFEPQVDGLEVTMRRCPFADIARESPAVVCGVHRGLVEGVLEETSSGLELRDLEVFPQPGVCVLRLEEHGRAGSPTERRTPRPMSRQSASPADAELRRDPEDGDRTDDRSRPGREVEELVDRVAETEDRGDEAAE
jgi:predicted ArsR family transcriptional regulator